MNTFKVLTGKNVYSIHNGAKDEHSSTITRFYNAVRNTKLDQGFCYLLLLSKLPTMY